MEQFQRYFIDTIKDRYAQFDGRASRSEFWYFTLFSFIISLALGFADDILGTAYTLAPGQAIGFISGLFSLALLIPSIAIAIRRLHDTGKSGWWLLVALVPIIGAFVLLYFYIIDSEPGENLYGANPKGE